MAVHKNTIVAVGNHLEYDPDFSTYERYDLHGAMVTPGLVDAHTHFYNFALLLNRVSLDGVDSLRKCLSLIKAFSDKQPKNGWVFGNGYSPDRFANREEPDRHMLDKVTGGRPAFIYSKDMHSAWVNSRALELAGITAKTRQPDGGEIVRFPDGSPSGILREISGYEPVAARVPAPTNTEINRCFKQALEHAYRVGVTGVHSFDGPDGFMYMADLAERGKLGLRVNYYPIAARLSRLEVTNTTYGTGTDFFRIAGIKIFADGALGSQTGYCFNKYIGTKNNRGIEVTGVPEMKSLIVRAGKLGLPCAVHAIGDRAVSNVLDAFEAAGVPRGGARHRIEHLQLVRRKDLARIKKLGVIASMQPSHCTSDIDMVRRILGQARRQCLCFSDNSRQGYRPGVRLRCPHRTAQSAGRYCRCRPPGPSGQPRCFLSRATNYRRGGDSRLYGRGGGCGGAAALPGTSAAGIPG